MESTTKNRQPVSVLRRMVQRAYGPDLVPESDDFADEMTEGWFNVAYRVRLRDGRQVVLKIAPPADVPVLTREIGMMRAELEAMRLVSEQTAVPVPRVDFADLTHELIDADYFFMEFIDAENFGLAAAAEQLDPAVVDAGNRELGVLNRQINSVVGPHFGPLLGPGYGTWREAFTAMVEDTIADGERAGVDIGWDYDQVREVLAGNAAVLDRVQVPQLVEVDLWAKNSMMKDGRIVAILDHERAIYGDPLMEAGLTGLDMPQFGDPAEFMEGMGLGELNPDQRTRRRLYSLYLALIMAVETKYRGHTDTEVYDFARTQLDAVMAALGQTH